MGFAYGPHATKASGRRRQEPNERLVSAGERARMNRKWLRDPTGQAAYADERLDLQ
jgi:hypothetical protein